MASWRFEPIHYAKRLNRICYASVTLLRHVSETTNLALQFGRASCTKRPWRVWLMCRIHQHARENHMGQSHPSTPEERVQWASHMLAHPGEYGLVTQLSRTLGVSRPTLYAWKAIAQQALAQAFCATPSTTSVPPTVARQIVTLLVEGHNSNTNIQTCLAALTGQHVSIGTIARV